MVGALHIKDVKSKKMPHVEKVNSAYTAAQTMTQEDATTLIVLDKKIICGTVSLRDIVAKVLLANLDPKTVPVGEIMDKKVNYIDEEKTTVDAARMMRDLKIEMLIATADSQAQGTITMRDIVEMYPALQLRLGGEENRPGN